MIRPPPEFGAPFLAWLKQETERAWRTYASHDYADPDGVGGVDWQRGTKWGKPLSEAEIDAAEKAFGLRFPDPYRLFLATLHAPEPRRQGYVFSKEGKVPAARPSFWNWREDGQAIREALEAVIDGIAFDAKHNTFWLETWGPKPADEAEQRRLIALRVGEAPKLVPVFGHRFLLQDLVYGWHPVLSIHQTDIIFYGMDLRHYLLNELGSLLGMPDEGFESFTLEMKDLPFWGEVARP